MYIHIHIYIYAFLFLSKSWILVRALTAAGQRLSHFSPIVNQAIHIPINCESKAVKWLPIKTQCVFVHGLPDTCKIYILKHSPCFTVIYKEKMRICGASLNISEKLHCCLRKYFLTYVGISICFCHFIFVTCRFLFFIVLLIFPLSKSFIFY